jgi:hypothetical protein
MNVNTEHFRHLHDVCKAVIADPRNANADTFKTAALNLAERYDDPMQALKNFYLDQSEFGDDLRKAAAIVVGKVDDDTEEIAKARNRDSATGAHGLAAALSEHLIDRLSRLRQQHGFEKANTEKETPAMTSHAEFVQNVVKQYGIVALAKSMVKDQKAYGLDENTFVKLATEHAQTVYPGQRSDTAFSKLDESEESVRRACQLAKAAPFAQTQANDHTESSEAYDELTVKAAELRKTQPSLTEAQSFSKVFTDPKNAVLAAKAHRRPSPTTSFAFPSR